MVTTQLETNIIKGVTPVYYANLNAINSKRFRKIANEGSTRSSKTYSIVQALITIAKSTKTSISIVSPSLPHLKKGAQRDFLQIMDDWLLFDEEEFNRTDQIYTFPSGGYIEFFGAEDSKKVRGPSRKILYVNELNLISKSTYTQMAIRTEDLIIFDYNPIDEFSYVYELADSKDCKLIHSTYLNNKKNLSAGQIAEIESLKDADENLWNVFGLGLRGTSSETIYTHWKIVDEMPGKGEKFAGQDFGYNVESAFMDQEFYEGGLYWDELIYETKLTTGDLIERYKGLDINKRLEIFCDNAEPKTIEEIVRAGYNAKPANKEVWEGIRKVKSLPLFITKRSVNTIKEIRSYKWKVDKNGLVLEEPVKFKDHAMDAGRYGAFTKLTTPSRSWSIV